MLIKKYVLTLFLSFTCLSGIAADGSFQSVLSGTFDWKSIDAVDGSKMLGIGEGSGMVIEGDKLFEAGMAFETVCLVEVRNHAGGRDITADCEIAYPELDSKMFLLLERKAGDIANEGAKGDGTQSILGGTNKLQGITGQCSYTIKYLDASRNISKNNCSYSL